MIRHAATMATWRSRADRHLLAWLVGMCSLTGCSRNQGVQRADIPSGEEAWVASACTPAAPDFSTWTRRQVGGVTVAAPPGYIVEQVALTNIGIRGAARQSSLGFFFERDAHRLYDVYYYRATQERNVCRALLGGYPADVVAWYDRGQYGLVARWEASWGGEDAGTWLFATLASTRLEEARDLRTVLHTIRPVGIVR